MEKFSNTDFNILCKGVQNYVADGFCPVDNHNMSTFFNRNAILYIFKRKNGIGSTVDVKYIFKWFGMFPMQHVLNRPV
jgi:hypothetical protein